MTWIVLATEDELSEAVGIRLAAEVGLEVGQSLRRGGSGYLSSRLGSFIEIAARQPVLILTDLDRVKCAPALVAKWMGGKGFPQNLLLRVAVREVESWLLADHDAMRGLLGVRVGRLPANPDLLPDPKAALLGLASKAPRSVREELVAEQDAVASQGLGYNSRLGQLIRDSWHPVRAASRSASLAKALVRLRELAAKVG